MKRLMMLKPYQCASGDFTKGKIYDVVKDELVVYLMIPEEDGSVDKDESTPFDYTKENIEKYSKYKTKRWMLVKDDSSEDSFEVDENDDRFIIFENDNELAHELINRIEGFGTTIVNMAMYFK